MIAIRPMRSLFFICLTLVTASAKAETEPGTDVARPPFELTRSLQALQDQIALGSKAAHAAQLNLLEHIGERLLTADPEVWREAKNARAAVVYVLSGGKPQVIRALLELGDTPAIQEGLLKGTLAYATGQEANAQVLLSQFDARRLPPGLGGHVALVQGTLIMRQKPRDAIQFLELARLLMPGTLVEEAALRRQLAIAKDLGDLKKFEILSRQYMSRFRNSIYLSDFRHSFTEFLAEFELPGDADIAPLLDALRNGFSEDEQREMNLSIARKALLGGRTATARFAGERAAQLSEPDSVESLQASLYQAAAQVAGAESEAAVRTLEEIDAGRLPPADAQLRDAALSVAKQIHKALDERSLLASSSAPEQDLESAESERIIERAREALSAADELLRSSTR